MGIDRDCDDLVTQKSVLDQKKMRINNEVEGHNKRIRELEMAKKDQVIDMNRLNVQRHTNTEKTQQLENVVYNFDKEFKQFLKKLESDSIKHENRIAELKQEKSEILKEIIESQKQILLWERKI